ncbi:MAG: hypothetical protein WC677_00475 [Clostridia bacterium]|jgi:hypothetical protein
MKDLKEHENYIRQALESENVNFNWVGLRDYHKSKIEFLQHERLTHLLVTLSFGLFFLISVFFTIVFPRMEIVLLDLLFLLLLIPYIVYYYKLENTVQFWYQIFSEINAKIK